MDSGKSLCVQGSRQTASIPTIQAPKSFLIVQEESIPRNTLEKNFDIVYSVPGSSSTPPVLVSNKLTNDIQIVRQHIQDLKNDAYKIARINEIMLSQVEVLGPF